MPATLNTVEISPEEINYLLDVSNAHFKTPLTALDIIATYSGVRPLCDDESDNPVLRLLVIILWLLDVTLDEAPLPFGIWWEVDDISQIS